ncbi:MAG: hypothetical protein M5R40_07275 [Anaerolineae bacterium]|nr:hypothetical protein [Anaerolineae bacterium]
MPAVVRPDIANAVGDDAECLAFWRRVVHDWVACGWNRENVKGMLDWFQRGELPTTAPNGRKSTRTGDVIRRTEEAAERFLAEQAGANDG